MATRKSISLAWNLLSFHEKGKLIVAITAQSFLNFLDLLGVLSLSFTTYLLTNKKFPHFKSISFLNHYDLNEVAFSCVALTIALFTVKGITAPFLYSRVMRFLTSISVRISMKIAKKLLTRPLDFLQSRNSQESAYSVSQGVTSAVNEILGSFIIFVSEIVLLSSLFIIMFLSNWILSLLNILIFGVTLTLLNKIVGDHQFRNTTKRINSILFGNSLVINMISAYRELSALKKMDFYLAEFQETRENESESASRGQVLNVIPKYIFEVSFYLGAGGILFFLYNFSDPKYAFTLFVLFIASGSRILPSILRIQAALSNIRSNEALSIRTYSLISDLGGIEDGTKSSNSILLSSIGQNLIEIKDLHFAYAESGDWSLNIDNLILPRGSRIAVVGPSGSGKSTLMDLIMGLLTPTRGTISFSDSICSSESGNLRLAYMPQKITVFNRSIRENIALGVPVTDIDDQLIHDCIRKSGLDKLVDSLTLGENELLNEDGSNLSGGQIQRLGFARVLYSKPDILVLDEATSSLDSESEFRISEAIDSLGTELSVISIAHRLNTIRNFDLVLYMENGKIEASGTFDEVRKKSPSFNSQSKRMGI